MSDTHDIDSLDAPLQRSDPKVRDCLRCGDSFESAWAGERICAHCKSSTTWRSGLPVRAGAGGGRR
jgi:hypothetical protein